MLEYLHLTNAARQVGKTFILDRFAKENFGNYIYISCVESSGEQFLKCKVEAEKWSPGTPRTTNTVLKAIQLYERTFVDTEDTIIVVDEIQESKEIYNLIRQFSRSFNCYFIVTGSYLAKILEPGFFSPVGDLDRLSMETLTFPEFLEALGYWDLYKNVDMAGGSQSEDYKILKENYKVYERIGGYPAVVKMYIQTKDLEKCEKEIVKIIQTFIEESKRYFKSIVDSSIFERLMEGIAVFLIKEKTGRDLVKELSKIVFKEESGKIGKQAISQAISWLHASRVIGYVDKCIDCNHLDVIMNQRFYYSDMGIANYFLTKTGEERDNIKGILAENFVYLSLKRHKKTAGDNPRFALYQKTKGELDFYVRSLIDYQNYGIEVKSEDNQSKTARRLFEDGKLDFLYYLKGDKQGGVAEDGKVITVALYLADRIKFDLGEVKGQLEAD